MCELMACSNDRMSGVQSHAVVIITQPALQVGPVLFCVIGGAAVRPGLALYSGVKVQPRAQTDRQAAHSSSQKNVSGCSTSQNNLQSGQ